MKINRVTMEQLAEKLGKTVWSKGDLKRIYLNDAGWNTKKMSTKTFIFQDENGDIKVSCRIDCPSQSYNWIESQEKEVKESIYENIASAIEKITNPKIEEDEIEEEQKQVFQTIESNYNLPLEVAAERMKAQRKETDKVRVDFNFMFGIGARVSHNRFGEGEVVSEDEAKIEIKFSEGVKNLLKKFANLEKL